MTLSCQSVVGANHWHFGWEMKDQRRMMQAAGTRTVPVQDLRLQHLGLSDRGLILGVELCCYSAVACALGL